MKKTIALALLIMSALSMAGQKYSVRGTVNAGNDGKFIYLAEYKNKRWVKNDSAQIKNNRFVFDGTVESPCLAYLLAYNDGKEIFSEFILENSIIAVNVILGEGMNTTVMGTKANYAYSQVKDAITIFNQNTAPLRRLLGNRNLGQQKTDSIRKLYFENSTKLLDGISQIAENNADNYCGMLLMQEYNLFSSWDIAKTKAFLGKVPADIQATEGYQKLYSYITVLEKTSAGQPFTDIAAKSPEGQDIKLSDYAGRGKLVLVDFWASWCGPCMAEMPNVAKAYEQYKSKGLEIVGVSLDNYAENWKKAIVEQKMSWPQMSELKGWKSENAATYGIRAVPATVLIGKDGKIIARDLRGKELLDKIGEILK